ncbi:hypothetical protein EXIGLDRAFT_778987 [Exidia glandulosa HHB12029]|uniref:Uncharacterized protein n=1 Tax=Exidia glandulosa HHB12029 TaxID=1314781 RepID=A0A165C9Q7_EXIGL|nr:hypothetical protein EXIGLDRAFT_778987 [Exidia glandulosa HHB12029]
MPRRLAAGLIVAGWLAVVVACIVGPLAIQTQSKGPFYGVTKEWCFITDPYADARLWIHYVPILVSAFVIFVLYTLVFLSLRGNIIADAGSIELRRRHPSSSSAVTDISNAQVANIARKMLWYPSSYVIIVLPISIVRLVSLGGKAKVPEWVWLLGITCLFLSGAVNAIIYSATRRALSPMHFLGQRRHQSHSRSSGSGNQRVPGSADKVDGAVWVTMEHERHYEDGRTLPSRITFDDAESDDRNSTKYSTQLVDEALDASTPLAPLDTARIAVADAPHRRSGSILFSDEMKPRHPPSPRQPDPVV